MTGGEAQIQDIQPYFGLEFNSLVDTEGSDEGNGGVDEGQILELKELARIDYGRSAKTVSVQPKKSVDGHSLAEMAFYYKNFFSSVVDVLIHYPANSVVDIKAVTSKLVSNNGTGAGLSPSRGNGTTMVRKLLEIQGIRPLYIYGTSFV